MNLSETLNSDIPRNDLLDDDSDIDIEKPRKERDEESKYGRLVSVANGYRRKQVKNQGGWQAVIFRC